MKLRISILFLLVPIMRVTAYNLRQITSLDGLSNSSIICLMQDDERFLWIGTYDGLNIYDGRNIRTFKPDIDNKSSLSSNVIRNIVETDHDYIWLSTKWGLNKFNQRRNIIEEYYEEFNEDCHISTDSNGNLFILGHKGFLSMYDKNGKTFINLPIDPDIASTGINGIVIDGDGIIWIANDGRLKRYQVILNQDEMPRIMALTEFSHPAPVDFLFGNTDHITIVDQADNIYDIRGEQATFVSNIAGLRKSNGTISSIIRDGQDFLIAFKSNGLVRLDANNGYTAEKININCGVFTLWKDIAQDIVWIGTDGQGVYALTKDEYTFDGLLLSELPVEKKRPVRAIQTDKKGNIWLGTKDNGLICIQNYKLKEYSPHSVTHYSTVNGLANNSVFAFAYNPNQEILWVGTDGSTINYFDYRDKKMHRLHQNASVDAVIRHVHSMTAWGDSLLWVGAGSELLKIKLKEYAGVFEAGDIKRYIFDVKHKQLTNQIYSLCTESDSILWVGMRGNGLIRFNANTGGSQYFTFDDNGIAPMNDVLCIYRDIRGLLWIGTSYGIIRFAADADGQYIYENINEKDGLPNNTIHGITGAFSGKLWLSSNAGLILFDPQNRTFRVLNQKTGLKTVEYSDNAYFRDEGDSTSFFGGIDGITWVTNSYGSAGKFVPEVYFTGLRIFNKEYNISEFEKKSKNGSFVELKHFQNFFAISFVSMDFRNGENGKYSYKLENFSDVWINTSSNEAQFTNITPGDYILHVRYNDGISDIIPLSPLHIRILPPWYQTMFSKMVFALLIISMLIFTYLFARKKYKTRKITVARQLAEKYKEEMYEGKLRFFTNVTHEFCTPLSLIYGPTKRILESNDTTPGIRKYASIIKSNTERLNSLIQEVIDFRRMETGNKLCVIRQLNIGKIIQEITVSFIELAEHNKITFRSEFNPEMIWNSDEGCIVKIFNNLISNAFKYTPEGGEIVVSVFNKESNLVISVFNTGPGISENNISQIFNRYTVLDNITENSTKGLSSRNGLGLAICHNMTELLQGKIEVQSRENEFTRFTITLPYLKEDAAEVVERETVRSEYTETSHTISKHKNGMEVATPQSKILIVDDNNEMLWMLKDIFQSDYLVLTAQDGRTGMEILKENNPDLIITDILMPDVDGITLTNQIKQNLHTMHIPLVILSAKNTTNDKIVGVESGADTYITKPFDIDYLKAVVKKLLEKKKNMETYYKTSASAFEFSGGELMSREDKDFMDKVVSIISDNIDNNEFSPDDLAGIMRVGTRKLYRKFSELNQLPPKDFIKECRITYASRLLQTTNMTIEEIIYKSGFSNRSHFYKEFSKRIHQTPREYRENHRIRDESLL